MTEIVVFDLETTIPATDIIEIGLIRIDAIRYFELGSYATLLHSDKITTRSVQCNGITDSMVANAPTFEQVADVIFDMFDGKVWCGYNIIAFDIPKLENAFNVIGRTPPKATRVIDVFPLLRATFGKRAGDMKLA